MGVEEAILSASFQVVFEKLASPVLREFGFQWGVDKELRKLGRTLSKIQAVLNDAEERQINDMAVKMWLDDLKDVAFDADDVLDEFATEALRLRLEVEGQASTNQVWSFVSSINPNMASFKLSVTSKIREITDQLDEIAKERVDLGLREGLGGRMIKIKERRQTSSLVDKSCVYGREEDKEKIIELLLSDGASEKNVSIISIVGMWGLGKTTLAQLAYNDERVAEHFEIKAWVSVSINFDVRRSTQAILESATRKAYNLDNLEPLQVSLKETLSEKKFLIVLDDVWNEDQSEWADLQAPFGVGAKGSKIIITARNAKVSSITRAIHTHHLAPLSNKDCWSLFLQCTFPPGNSNEYPNLVAIGKKIVKKCGGLPSTTKTIGALLESTVDEDAWEHVLRSEIWDLQDDRNEFLSALKLSYYHLPEHLKRCFTYCSIFPKGYEFRREKLVLLWIAEGFVQPKGKKQLEDIGGEYFEDLFNQSFFQRSKHNNLLFVMHEFVHDLAQSISRELCFRWESDKTCNISERTRHSSFFLVPSKPSDFQAVYKAKRLRTFLLQRAYMFQSLPNDLALHNLFLTLRCLRVLCFNQVSITQLPESIGNLKHLRYLDLSRTWIIRLPESTNNLYNLQTLILSECPNLTDLPKNMGSLINLRHLYLNTSCQLEEMPLGIGRLTSLQSLSYFVVGKQSGSGIGELKGMLHLKGALCISQLQNIANAMDAKEANLKNKHHLQELELEWSDENNVDSDERVKENVLEYLQPHKKLKKLMIRCYGGKRFPTWMKDSFLPNMVLLSLYDCRNCELLPTVGQLPLLKHLIVSKMQQVKHVGLEFIGQGLFKGFPALETLQFEDMPKWEEWPKVEEGVFPHLQNLHIKNCSTLRKFSHRFPTLIMLEIRGCEELTSLPRFMLHGEEFPCLHKLIVHNCPKLRELPQLLPTLVKLELQDCKEIMTLPRLPSLCYLKLEGLAALQRLSYQLLGNAESAKGGLPCLRELTVWNCLELLQLPHLLPSLVKLDIHKCKKLTAIPGPFLPYNLELGEGKEYPLLSELIIKDCPELKGLHHNLPSLVKLEIKRCQALAAIPRLSSLCAMEIDECEEILLELLHDHESLSSLCISKMSKLMYLPKGLSKTLKSLGELKIANCGELMSLWKDIGLESFDSLRRLEFWLCPKLVSLPEEGLSTMLEHLKLMYCSNLESLPRGLHLIPLADLEISNAEKLTSFPEEGLPPTLTRLVIKECKNLESLPKGLHNVSSLQLLEIRRCPRLESFPKEGLPATLKWISIFGCENLKSLPSGLCNLTFLKELRISNVPKLASLPEDGLPTTLCYLDIEACPLLTARCRKEEGEDWPKIGHIPDKRIDGEEIF